MSSYMKADWTPIALMGMQSMQSAIELINETLDGTGFAAFDLDSLRPSEEVIESWRYEVEKVDVRNYLLGIVEYEATISGR